MGARNAGPTYDLLLYFLIVLLIFTPTEQRAAPLSVEAALEVGTVPTFPHDDEQSITPYPNHLELSDDDSGWSSEDEDDQATPPSSRGLINVYSAYSWLQQRTQ